MAETQLYHLGKNGPAPCGARKRVCRYAALPHGEESEMIAHWEAQQEAEYDDFLTGVSKPQVQEVEKNTKASTVESLSQKDKYRVASDGWVHSEEEIDVAMKVATEEVSPIGYTEVLQEDTAWATNGFSTVRKLELSDGTSGYFKSIKMNAENDESVFDEYGTTSLSAATNEVNAYRLAEALGDEYKDLVPETSFTVYNGEVGTIQRDAVEFRSHVEESFAGEERLKEDYRRAAIFDFVSGNLDRHRNNFLYSESNGEKRIVLIDNSFTFTDHEKFGDINTSIFADNDSVAPRYSNNKSAYKLSEDDLVLTDDDRKRLNKVRSTISDWEKKGTILEGSARSFRDRIDALLEGESIPCFSNWYMEESSWVRLRVEGR